MSSAHDCAEATFYLGTAYLLGVSFNYRESRLNAPFSCHKAVFSILLHSLVFVHLPGVPINMSLLTVLYIWVHAYVCTNFA